MHSPNLTRYLSAHAEPEVTAYTEKVMKTYQHCLVVPIFDEDPACLQTVLKHQTDINGLVVAVVNVPENANADARARTLAMLNQVGTHSPLDTLVIDRVTTPVDTKKGVGLARKIGTDIALDLVLRGRVANPWIYQTDADAQLPEGYFATPLPHSGAVVFPHKHISSNDILQQAVTLYDLHMRHYLNGLRTAGSNYAYPTLGSTLAVHASTYAKVRGFPKRNAGEDFYLLNKIAKIDHVTTLSAPIISLTARQSARVPFGTGPALLSIVEGLKLDPSGRFYTSYHPASFELLKSALQILNEWIEGQVPPHTPALEILQDLGLEKITTSLGKQPHSVQQQHKMLNDWFDAGKTLRFVHLARRHNADVSLLDTLQGSLRSTAIDPSAH